MIKEETLIGFFFLVSRNVASPPAGLKAMKELKKVSLEDEKTASDEMEESSSCWVNR